MFFGPKTFKIICSFLVALNFEMEEGQCTSEKQRNSTLVLWENICV